MTHPGTFSRVNRGACLLLWALGCAEEQPGHLWVAVSTPYTEPLDSVVFASGSHAFLGLSTELSYREQRWPTVTAIEVDDAAIARGSTTTEVPTGLTGDHAPQSMVALQCGSAGSTPIAVTVDTGERVSGEVHVAAPESARDLVIVRDANLTFPWTQAMEQIAIDAIVPAEGLVLVPDTDEPELQIAVEPLDASGESLAGWGSFAWASDPSVTLSTPRRAILEESKDGYLVFRFFDVVEVDGAAMGRALVRAGELVSVPLEVVPTATAARLEFYAMRGNGILGSHELLADSAGATIELRTGDIANVFVMPFSADARPIVGLHRDSAVVLEGTDVIDLQPAAVDVAEGRVVGSDHMLMVTARAQGSASVRAVVGGVEVIIPIVVH